MKECVCIAAKYTVTIKQPYAMRFAAGYDVGTNAGVVTGHGFFRGHDQVEKCLELRSRHTTLPNPSPVREQAGANKPARTPARPVALCSSVSTLAAGAV